MPSICATAGWTSASACARTARRGTRPAKQGLRVLDTAEAAREADIIMVLVPDEMGADIYQSEIESASDRPASTSPSATASISISSSSQPPKDVNVFMIAPKGPGHLVRSEYVKGRGVPCLLAIQQDPSGDTQQDRARLWVPRSAAARAAMIETTLQGRDRNRSVRRAVGAVRRTDRTDSRRLRDSGRGGLRARDGVLRMPARGEADRRPDLRGRHLEHALLDQQHRRIRRYDARQAGGRARTRARR